TRAGGIGSRPLGAPRWLRGLGVGGLAGGYLGIIVLLPLAALLAQVRTGGFDGFWTAVSTPANVNALELTLGLAALATVVNAIMGTLVAWVLVRDRFPGIGVIDSLVDLPFALPTIVAGLTIIALYGPRSPLGVNVTYTRTAILVALLFVTLPFVVRAVQPVLTALEPEVEEAASTLGASRLQTFRRVVLPPLVPAIATGAGLSFAKAVGEFGSVVLISGNLPGKTQVASVAIAGLAASGDTSGAAALSAVLLAISLVVLLAIAMVGWRTGKRHG
ncbi:MAG: sulfate ABC transporter permease subunit CysT, partial [Gaiellales bacterium]